MNHQDIKDKIKKGNFVTLKISYNYPREVLFEVTDSSGNVIHRQSSKIKNTDEASSCIEMYQLKMLKIAGEYMNSGTYPIINPFTN